MTSTLLSPNPSAPDLLRALAIGLALSAFFVGLRLSLTPLLQDSAPLLVLLAAPILAAWRGGLVAGLSATAASAVMGELLIIEPRFELLPVGAAEWVRLTVFMLYGTIFSALIDSRRRTLERVRHDLDTLTDAQRERQNAEDRLRDAHRRKDEFISMLAHELRNPLAPVRNAVEILKHLPEPTPRLQRSRDIIERQVEHMARLIDDLLDVSRLVRGSVAIHPEPCDLASVARQVAEDWQPAIEAAGLRLEVDLRGPLPVHGDRVRLVQMLGNLLANASRYNRPGGWVQVAADIDESGRMARVCVSDSGMGIEPELLGRIFEPFEQANRDLARGQGGLGLGLALTRGLAELHGGTVTAESDGAGSGARFTVLIPLLAAHEPGTDEKAPDPDPAPRR
jgi:signal transduction histidine kinase